MPQIPSRILRKRIGLSFEARWWAASRPAATNFATVPRPTPELTLASPRFTPGELAVPDHMCHAQTLQRFPIRFTASDANAAKLGFTFDQRLGPRNASSRKRRRGGIALIRL